MAGDCTGVCTADGVVLVSTMWFNAPQMDLRTYLNGLDGPAREAFAIAAGTTLGHLKNVAYGQRIASASLAMQIELASAGAVTRQVLRPTDWHLIWPPGCHQLIDADILAQSEKRTHPLEGEEGGCEAGEGAPQLSNDQPPAPRKDDGDGQPATPLSMGVDQRLHGADLCPEGMDSVVLPDRRAA
jgi:DNA-binding transcriptional regulator YdaS (Cro superfamily)